MTIPSDELRRKWRTDPDFVARHEEIAPEMALAFELADARRAAGLTQAQLAERMDTTQSTVARWEKGAQEPSIPQPAQVRPRGRPPRQGGARARIGLRPSRQPRAACIRAAPAR
ncbi:helix-turn-helix transcriptional regulator [Alsobacter sp. SYSU BS001988]|jgi:hypothetical protein